MTFPQKAYDHEKPVAVFAALVETLPEGQREEWRERWNVAMSAQNVMRRHDRDWDRSLTGVTRWGQGGG